jgi:hypothetical protein
MSPSAIATAERAGRGRGFPIYPLVVILMTGVVLLGFWPYYAALLSGAPPGGPVIHLHAAVFSGWLLLLFAQTLLVRQRRLDWHRRLGRWSIPYAGALVIAGLAATFLVSAAHVREGRHTVDEVAAFLLLPLGDLVLFVGFFSAAIFQRGTPEVHKRLMLLAATALIFPAAARFGDPWGLPAVLALWLMPLAVAIAYELFIRRRIAAVYLLGVAILLVASTRLAVMDSEAWLLPGRALLRPFL